MKTYTVTLVYQKTITRDVEAIDGSDAILELARVVREHPNQYDMDAFNLDNVSATLKKS